MRLRVNPQTGRLAELVPAEASAPGREWFTYRFDEVAGLTVELLSHEQVANWPEVGLAPKPPDPEFHFATACAVCEPHGLLTNPHERDIRHRAHDETHSTARYAVRIQHPDTDSGAQVVHEPGDPVTFHGSAEGDVADLVHATVLRAAEMADEDGEPVDGYVVNAGGRQLFVPATALARATGE